ncbi:type II toxin-antitoxin system RelE/ParE family toxin [Schleiferilactobacillus perolens]|jgi:phage-related protein|uniref:type II toxin-antitoxin system RelE/ParE family toxin n=1 Tax=Schleiferilactobacillus perolens TaxID=100468 RepID=UPI002354D6EB|nr:type II toxin-antitoxin system RelE/ParE family toxin [Schleiferilactobacillus perolens]MCI1890503.1 type II toxin-antitoxin system RelE/ParE family toxin [Schleiferilactobacillus harbinensis]MCI1911658.1 type II toxin-antitoxin system RelE/ParE family toxin [Schleiferilactobacillus harbinensis]MCI2171807.1 type II toxin-antitoxin system RelE/ParE family toxin [Schleiferilactobacillus perolens]
MKRPKFRAYKRPNGHQEFVEYFKSLPPKEQAKLQAVIETVEEKGITIASRLLLVKRLDKNLYELRSRQGKDYQRALYFHVVDNDYVITHGFSKKTNRTPQREIDHAIDLRAEFYRNYKGDQQL